MKTRWAFAIASAVAVAMWIGCSSNNDAPQRDAVDEAAPATPGAQDEMPEPGSGTREMGSGTRPVEPVVTDPMPDVPAEPEDVSELEPPAEPVADRVKADVGVALAGRSLDEYEGMYVTPAKALFGFREKAVFQIQIPKALQLYKGVNGSNPKTHDEFMSQIIQANSIQLPELPPGDRYVYDPEKGELMVEKRRR